MDAVFIRRTSLVFLIISISLLAAMEIDAQTLATSPTTLPAITADKWLDILLKAAALLAGGGWFLYRAIAGYITVNLAMELEIERKRQDDRENVSVKVVIKKGDQGKLELYTVKIRLRVADNLVTEAQPITSPRIVSFGNDVSVNTQYMTCEIAEISRLALNDTDNNLVYTRHARQNSRLRLAPGDEMTFSCLYQVPLNSICIVDAAVLGQKLAGHRTGQWRSSAISLPDAVSIPGQEHYRRAPIPRRSNPILRLFQSSLRDRRRAGS